ncbi:unnamed protein product [Ascophyllum nodosum]
MEALSLLRAYTMGGKHIKNDGEYFVFGHRRVPKDTPTAWKSQVGGEYYTVKQLMLLLEHINDPMGTYIAACTRHKEKWVASIEKMDVLNYLQGNTDSAAQIDKNAAPAAAERSNKRSLADHQQGMTETEMREAKKAHAQRLDNRGGGGTRAGLLSGSQDPLLAARVENSGIDGISQDKLLELRAKRLSHKRNTIVSVGDESADTSVDPKFLDADKAIVAEIRSKEISFANRNSILRKEGKSFKFALEFYNQVRRKEKDQARESVDASYGKRKTREARQSSSSSRGASSSSGSAAGRAGGGPAEGELAGVTPVIIVPNVLSSLVTLHNVKDLLEDGRFVTPTEKKEKGERKPSEVVIERTNSQGKLMKYRFIDNATRLHPKEWKACVCVLVQGAAWQFKGWQWEQPVSLFQNVLGVHLKFDDVRVNEKVAQWNVRVLEVHKHKRHMDTGAFLEFWRLLDEFMLLNKPEMMA